MEGLDELSPTGFGSRLIRLGPMKRSMERYGAPTEVGRRDSISVRAGGALRLAVVSDTHSAPHEKGLTHLKALKPDAILHAGDIGDLEVLERLGAIAPVHAIRGNIDVVTPELPDALTVDLRKGDAIVLRLLLVHVGVAGVRLRADAFRLATREHASLVVCGHSHVPFIGVDRGLTIFNPGSMGPRRFNLPIVFGVADLGTAGLRLRHLDCETGKTWTP